METALTLLLWALVAAAWSVAAFVIAVMSAGVSVVLGLVWQLWKERNN